MSFGDVPEEIQARILRLLPIPSLYVSAQVSRDLNRLAVHQGLTKLKVRDAKNASEIHVQASRREDAISFLLISVHIRAFDRLIVNFNWILQPFENIWRIYHLDRLSNLLERPGTIVTRLIVYFKVASLGWRNEDKGSPLRNAFQRLFNVIAAKVSVQKLSLYDFSERSLDAGYSFKTLTGEPSITSGSIEEDNKRYKPDDDKMWVPGSIQYPEVPRCGQPDSGEGLLTLDITTPFLVPPFANWVFHFYKTHHPEHLSLSWTTSQDDDDEDRFIISRLATAHPQLSSLFVGCRVWGSLKAILGNFKLLSKNLTHLILHGAADGKRDELCDSGLDIELPVLETLHATPSVVRSLFSPDNTINAPEITTITIVSFDGETYGQAFSSIDIAKTALMIQSRLTESGASSDQGETTPPGSTGDRLATSKTSVLPSTVEICAHVEFHCMKLRGLSESLRKGILPEMEPELLTALQTIHDVSLILPTDVATGDIYHGLYKEELIAVVTAFPGVHHFQAQGYFHGGKLLPMEESLFNTLKVHGRSLVKASVR